jgi:hypothetical protein
VGGGGAWTADELVNQIHVTRKQGSSTGNVHFSMTAFMPKGTAAARAERDSLAARLMRETYATPALVPASPWLSSGHTAALVAPSVREDRDARTGATFLIATAPATQVARSWIISRWDGHTWSSDLQPANSNTLTLAVSAAAGEGVGYWISYTDRVGTESPRTGWLRTGDGATRTITR